MDLIAAKLFSWWLQFYQVVYINAFQKNHKDILKVRSKVFPFSMKELIEEVKATEVLNQLPDEIKNKLFAAGAQLDSIELLEECDEIDQLLTEFDS